MVNSFATVITFSGTSVTLGGEQHHLDSHLSYQRACLHAIDYLQKFGVQYVLVVLDELETVAEAATFGLEQDDAKRLDGQAIRLIGKAIKEVFEDGSVTSLFAGRS